MKKLLQNATERDKKLNRQSRLYTVFILEGIMKKLLQNATERLKKIRMRTTSDNFEGV